MKTHPGQALEIREDDPVLSALLELINQVFDSPPDGFCAATTATSGSYKASEREIKN
jgi:hypothetical protein